MEDWQGQSSGLQAKNIIQVSMDGPSVNWKFYGELKKKVNTDYGTLTAAVSQDVKTTVREIPWSRKAEEKTEQERSKRKCVLEETDEVKKKKKRIDAEIKSLNDTADELCTKAEATAKLTFVTQVNALRWSAKDKLNDLVSLDKKLSSMLEKLKEWFCTTLSFGCKTLFALTGIALLEWLWKKCDVVPVETDSLNIVKSPGKVLEKSLNKRSSNLYKPWTRIFLA